MNHVQDNYKTIHGDIFDVFQNTCISAVAFACTKVLMYFKHNATSVVQKGNISFLQLATRIKTNLFNGVSLNG
jgi:hypothetical protein